MRWHWGINALSHSPTSWMASVLSQWGLFSWLLITMCHCTEQDSYMGHPSPSSLWIRDGTGRDDALLKSRKSRLRLGSFVETGRMFGRNIGWILEHLVSRWSKRTSGIATFFCLQTICHPGRTHFAAGDAETLAKIRRRVKQRPLITKHCIAGRRQRHPTLFPYSGSFIVSCIVSWPQGVRRNIILCDRWPWSSQPASCCIVWTQQVCIRTDSVGTAFYAVTLPSPRPPLLIQHVDSGWDVLASTLLV